MEKDTAEKIALTYINEKVSMAVLANRFGVSKATVVRALNDKNLNPSLRGVVEETKKQRWIEGKSTSGNADKTVLSKEEAQSLAKNMVEKDLTLRDLVREDGSGPVVGTIYNSFTEENLGSELYQMVTEQYKENKAHPNHKTGSNSPKGK